MLALKDWNVFMPKSACLMMVWVVLIKSDHELDGVCGLNDVCSEMEESI